MGTMIFDSSTIISVSDSCLMQVLERLKRKTGMEFIIPVGVEKESVFTPSKIRRFELSAVRVKEAIEDGWIKVAKQDKALTDMTKKVLGIANRVFSSNGKDISIIQEGEAETIALAKNLGAEAIAIDERTTRMLFEDAPRLKSFMEYKYQEKFNLNTEMLDELAGIFGKTKIFRSTELIALAFELGLFEPDLGEKKQDLEAALFSLKYHGCAVSGNEIEEFVSNK